MTDLDAALVEQFLNVPVAQRKAMIEPDGVLDGDHGETVAVWFGVGHGQSDYPDPIKATQPLCPTLEPGEVVVMDNLSSHHRASIRTLIEARECTLLYLSPYSPDFNPIEMMFSKLKALIRGGGWSTVDTLIDAIGRALQAVTPFDTFGWFKHAHPHMFL